MSSHEIRVEQGSNKHREHTETSVNTKLEKLLPPILTYVIRKILLYTLVINLKLVDSVSRMFGFHYSYALSDRQEWNWLSNIKIPRYGVIRKDA
jgi:hypothetical protein